MALSFMMNVHKKSHLATKLDNIAFPSDTA